MRYATILAAVVLAMLELYFVFVQSLTTPAHILAATLSVLLVLLLLAP